MGRILDRVSGPQDLKALDNPTLAALAEELRQEIINTVAVTGGHLAPNLGWLSLLWPCTECLTALAPHHLGRRTPMLCPQACYGRKHLFYTLRQYGGISGFPKPTESEHDAFVAATAARHKH